MLSDAFGMLVALADLDNDWDKTNWIQTKAMSKKQRFIMFIMKPLTALLAAYKVLTWRNDRNCIKNSGLDLVGERNSQFAKIFSVPMLKKIAALHKGTK